MGDDELFWLERSAAALPYRREPMETAPAPLRALVDCGAGAQALRWRLDWALLGEAQRTWLESGEYLPALGYYWLERAAALMQLAAQQKQSAAILEVPSRRLTQLAISDLMHALSGDAWLDDAQVALVWGFGHEALMHPQAIRWPLLCRGAVFPCGDGLDVGWWAPAAEIAKL